MTELPHIEYIKKLATMGAQMCRKVPPEEFWKHLVETYSDPNYEGGSLTSEEHARVLVEMLATATTLLAAAKVARDVNVTVDTLIDLLDKE